MKDQTEILDKKKRQEEKKLLAKEKEERRKEKMEEKDKLRNEKEIKRQIKWRAMMEEKEKEIIEKEKERIEKNRRRLEKEREQEKREKEELRIEKEKQRKEHERIIKIKKNKTNEMKTFWKKFTNINYKYLDLFTIKYENIQKNKNINAVLIDFNTDKSIIEFVFKNFLIKLQDKVCYTIVCGNLNEKDIIELNDKIGGFINIIKYDYDNVTVQQYNELLCSEKFWKNLKGDKILIYHANTSLFKSNIDDFLEYDYIGAPSMPIIKLPLFEKDKRTNVRNTYLSLRSKSAMLKVINYHTNDITLFEKAELDRRLQSDIHISQNTVNYMRSNNLTIIPENVYLENSLFHLKLGKTPTFKQATNFSMNEFYNKDSFGGDNWWIHYITHTDLNLFEYLDYNYFETIFTHIFDCIGIILPYNFSIGGNEKYITHIMKFFIEKKYIVVFFTINNENDIYKRLSEYLSTEEIKYIKYVNYSNILYKNYYKQLKFKYVITIGDSSIPELEGRGDINIYYCKFPCDIENFDNKKDRLLAYDQKILKEKKDEERRKILGSYNYYIVNSEFSYIYLKKCYSEELSKRIEICYPPCFEKVNEKNYNKIENSFIMIGGISKANPKLNNKYLNIAIKCFNRLKDLDYKLIIIGTINDIDYYNQLNSIVKDNKKIEIIGEVSEEEKYKYLEKSKYIIQLTGINDNSVINCEHFGISLMEGINNGCIPICYNNGYCKYFIDNNINGYLVEDVLDLYEKLEKIIKERKDINIVSLKDKIVNFTNKNFRDKLNNIINRVF
tara:strand:- start:380 stop:2728 length:2349 start_codon:yes stop_codon:yes gene_type:complete